MVAIASIDARHNSIEANASMVPYRATHTLAIEKSFNP